MRNFNRNVGVHLDKTNGHLEGDHMFGTESVHISKMYLITNYSRTD